MEEGTAFGNGVGDACAIKIDPCRLPQDQVEKQLHQAARKGELETAKRIFDDHPQEFEAIFNDSGSRALHIAIEAGNTEFVRWLVDKMNDNQLTLKDEDGKTAFCLAASNGQKELALIMINKNPGLAAIRGRGGRLPIDMAAFPGNREMVKLLYEKTDFYQLGQDDRTSLLLSLNESDMFDVALDMIVIDVDGREQLFFPAETLLFVLAGKPQMHSNSRFSILSCSEDAQKKKALVLVDRICKRMANMDDSEMMMLVGNGWHSVFVAVENGNVEFLRAVIKNYPDLVTRTNNDGHTIFHAAVLHRQKEIFELIHSTGWKEKKIAMMVDNGGNNMLHLAAQLAPPRRLASITGEALQLQHERWWFQKVERLVGPRLAQERNRGDNPQTPHELFIQEHQEMMEKAEAWVKNTASQCMFFAIFVAALVFAPACAVTGGYPMFLHDIANKIYEVAVVISFIFSFASGVTFLSFTSPCSLEDYVPISLLFGLATLFISISSLMVAFVTVFFMYFKQHHVYHVYFVPIPLICFLPPFMFFWHHKGLFFRYY